MKVFSLLLLAAILVSQSAAAAPSAREELQSLRSELAAARKADDREKVLQTSLRLQTFLNHSPRSVAETARAYASMGKTDEALLALEELSAMGTSKDQAPLDSKSFASVASQPKFRRLLERFADNQSSISRGTLVFSLPNPNFVAEDIDYDSQTESFLITGVLAKKIIRVTSAGRAADFAPSPSHWPMMAIKIDQKQKLVWATEVALDGFATVSQADWGRSALLCFDLKNGKLLRRIEGPRKCALGDMVLTPEGGPIVCDGAGGGIYHLTGDHLERLDRGDFVSPQTPAMHPDGKRIFVPDYLRGIALFDPMARTATWLKSGSPPHALNGIDGLYRSHDSLVATQNGTSPERVVAFGLNPTLTRAISERVIERMTPTLGDPTHGVLVGNIFYYLTNSGWSELDDHGKPTPHGKLTPAHLMRFSLD